MAKKTTTQRRISSPEWPRIFSQSFAEAGGAEVFSDLEPVGNIHVSIGSYALRKSEFTVGLIETLDGRNRGNHRLVIREGLSYVREKELEPIAEGVRECLSSLGFDCERPLNVSDDPKILALSQAVRWYSELRGYSAFFGVEIGTESFFGDAYRTNNQKHLNQEGVK